MNRIDPDDLRQQIWELVGTGQEANIRRAADVCRLLPPPSEIPDELTAQCIFDVGFGVEFFADDDLALELYRRVLRYPVADTKYVAKAWYRIGVCTSRQGNLCEAIDCYREALRVEQDLPHMRALACFHLAELLESSECYEEAAEFFGKVLAMPPHPEIIHSRVVLGYARNSWRAGKDRDAIARLESVAEAAEDPVSAEAWQLLAEIAEEIHNDAQAEAAYRNIISNPHSDSSLRSAAAYRLESRRSRTWRDGRW